MTADIPSRDGGREVRRPAANTTTNASEYWAEGAQWWFFSNYPECFTGNVKVETPDDLKAYDPTLFELLGRVFDTHRIPMDVFHGRQVRKVNCQAR